jgi:hypothetical protein
MAFQGMILAFRDIRNGERIEHLLRTARELAEREAHPHALGMSLIGSGIHAMMRGNYRQAEALLREGTTLLQERCAGVPWELDFGRIQWATCLWQLGELRQLAALVSSLLEDARERGNLHCETMVRLTSEYLVHLAADEPERARETLRTGMRRWTQRNYHVQHYRESAAQVRLALYLGEGTRALSITRGRRTLLLRSGLMRVHALRVEARYWDALAALAADPRGNGAVQRQALGTARALEREHVSWAAAPLGALLRAAVARRKGEDAEALRLLTVAEEGARSHGMALVSAFIQRRRGEVLGGEEGWALIAQADAWLTAQSVRNPERMAAIVTPSMAKPGS